MHEIKIRRTDKYCGVNAHGKIVFHDFDIAADMALDGHDGQPDTDINRPGNDLSRLWLSYRARRVWKVIEDCRIR